MEYPDHSHRRWTDILNQAIPTPCTQSGSLPKNTDTMAHFWRDIARVFGNNAYSAVASSDLPDGFLDGFCYLLFCFSPAELIALAGYVVPSPRSRTVNSKVMLPSEVLSKATQNSTRTECRMLQHSILRSIRLQARRIRHVECLPFMLRLRMDQAQSQLICRVDTSSAYFVRRTRTVRHLKPHKIIFFIE
ncbi:hypothetical protein BDY19DRAFT_426581 [Irpex rosettiformis]|uniref:Uncharacterized protein n=1 Tax=Irpex rosettiformis TaxID=378272 RepID=A0ACB8UG99_9APHY|nr:hypothetical protein BDY19DRAFT_426581 [Irpex rosettiformis]